MELAKKYKPDLTLLVADDHSLTRSMIKAILRGVGFENVTQAENGIEALHEIITGRIDIVICDWNMPKANGLEVLRQVRADARERTDSRARAGSFRLCLPVAERYE